MSRTRARARSPQLVIQPERKPLIEINEARRRGSTPSNTNRSFSLAWDENEALGITPDMRRSGPGMLSDQERKETLYKAYLNNVWISACVDVIAKRITSGGYVIEEVERGKGDPANYDTIKQLLSFVNDDDDFLQLVRSFITDLGIYGEAYMEIVYKAGKPYALHKIDCITMNYKLERHGQVVQYIQNMTHSTDTITFEPNEVIRWWMPDPQAHKKALSPIERILGPVDTSTRMDDWVRQFFRKGARPNFWIKYPGPKAEAERFVIYLRENYTGQANAHVPLVLYDEAELFEIGKGSVDIDFSKGDDQMRNKILAGYQVPPAALSQIESGNIGGGTGESQDKSLQFNACDPFKQLFFEKFNYRIIQKGLGITDWKVNCRYADYRSDEAISGVQDRRIRNGSNTINEVRGEMGKTDIQGGDTAIVVASKDIIPVPRLADMEDEQRQGAELDLTTKAAQADMAKTKADQAKNPPPPPPMLPGQQPPHLQAQQGQQQQGKQQQPPAQQKQAKEAQMEELEDSEVDGSYWGEFMAMNNYPLEKYRPEQYQEAFRTWYGAYILWLQEAHKPLDSELIGAEPLLSYDVKKDIWEPDDVDDQLQAFASRGVEYLKWTAHVSASGNCPTCEKNDGEVRKLSEAFSSGHRIPQCHPNCQCEVEPCQHDGKPL